MTRAGARRPPGARRLQPSDIRPGARRLQPSGISPGARRLQPSGIVVLKFGGELLESNERLAAAAKAVALAAKAVPLVVVHGGGREIDVALAQAGITKVQVDGLRVTDAPTLQVVVAVLAGAINTRFVASINACGGHAAGLTGADAGVAPVRKAPPHTATDGRRVDLGLVGQPASAPKPAVITALLAQRVTPVIACVSSDRRGRLFNVNADTLAASLAARLGATRLVIAGGTAGVFDEAGGTIPVLGTRAMRVMVRSGTASAGMVAKLAACRAALDGGVKDVVIVDGKDARRLVAAVKGTRVDNATFIER